MTPFRTILVAADFSEASREAFHAACSLAREDKTRLFVLNVFEPNYQPETPVYLTDQSVQYTLIPRDPSEHTAQKERLRQIYSPDRPVDVTYRTAEGTPAEEILRVAEDLGCDLIVMGTHGRTGLRRLLTGSVAEAVLRRARCPVLVLREPETRGDRSGDEIVLHPTDFSDQAELALRTARAIAQARGLRLVVLHVVPPMYSEIPITFDLGPARAALDAISSEVDGPDLKLPVEPRLVEGDAAEEILRVSRDEPGPGLIVMGTHGRSGLSRLLMGSVAEAVQRRSAWPVLTVKSPDAQPIHASPESAPGHVPA